MVLEHRFHKCIDVEVKRQALLEQKDIMDSSEKLNFFGFKNIDTPFPTKQGQKTVREILHELKRNGRFIVHNIQIHPTIDKITIWTTKDNDDIVYLQTTIKRLFDSLEASGDLLQQTGSNQRPRWFARDETMNFFRASMIVNASPTKEHESVDALYVQMKYTCFKVDEVACLTKGL
jgi:hypothetical protein